MHATYAENAKIEPGPNFFYDERKFCMQCVNEIDATCCRIYLRVEISKSMCNGLK